MDKKQKILVSGDVEGKFKTLFSRVQAINDKSGPFDFLFCVGDFFGESASNWDPYKNGTLKVPIPTYILGPNKEIHSAFYSDINGCELCPNVSYLGKRGLLSSSGLSIAYLSGTEAHESSPTKFSKKEVTDLKDIVMRSKIASSTFLGVDILLTSAWPRNVINHDKDCSIQGPLNSESEQLSWLSTHIRPRYHFAGLENIYYERPPYANYHQGNETSVHCTRFIALPKVGNLKKQKWLYAASLTPIDQMKAMDLYQVTTDETACPFPNPVSKGSQAGGGQQFFYDMDATDDSKKRRGQGERFERKRQAIDQNTCWFCLGSPSVEKHLVVSIGEQVYLALAKGGLTEFHAMILPVQHHRSLAHISDDIRSEIKKFKSALKKFCKKKKMVPVYFERNYKTSHMQLNMIPVPKSVSGKLKTAFMSSSQELELDLEELPEHCKLEDTAQVDQPYFYVELPTSERLFCSCKKNFPLDFGRDVLAGDELLDLPHRVSWRDCIVSKPEETQLTETFRNDFKEFDFTNDDDSATVE